ncbi:hypothetical protein FRC02_010307 [Tulasnella sp. 418]|nr:hypothetical protein FRC02_010307 [Tulasnella sp. 418]
MTVHWMLKMRSLLNFLKNLWVKEKGHPERWKRERSRILVHRSRTRTSNPLAVQAQHRELTEPAADEVRILIPWYHLHRRLAQRLERCREAGTLASVHCNFV